MSVVEALAILAAGAAAGAINTIVGSGSLVTFPTLLAFGYAPVVANVSNTVGLVTGSVSGAIGYRRELAGQRERAIRLGVVSAAGGLVGGIALLALPAAAFSRVVPFLILLASALMLVQPALARSLAARRGDAAGPSPLLVAGIFATGIYGGYFGAAQSVILIAILGIGLADGLQRLNALKNVLTGVVNAIAALLFVVAPLVLPVPGVAWGPAALIAIGSILGGQVGASLGRRIPAGALRLIIVVVGTLVGIRLLLG